MMSASFYIRIIGTPGRFPALEIFLKYVKSKQNIQIATREEIARFYLEKFA